MFWRLWRRLPLIPAPGAGPAPPLRRRDSLLAAFPAKCPSLTGPDAFRFLNRDGRVRNAADWNDPQADALWLYNLHYFDDLCAEGADARRGWHEALIARWMAENPVGQGAGWDAYPLSLRVVNWIKHSLARGAADPRAADRAGAVVDGLSAPALHSLAVQSRYLAPRVEWQLLGNHVLANAVNGHPNFPSGRGPRNPRCHRREPLLRARRPRCFALDPARSDTPLRRTGALGGKESGARAGKILARKGGGAVARGLSGSGGSR